MPQFLILWGHLGPSAQVDAGQLTYLRDDVLPFGIKDGKGSVKLGIGSSESFPGCTSQQRATGRAADFLPLRTSVYDCLEIVAVDNL